MTATPVEARSLSSLTSLFASPPQYPRNPTHQILDPLVLYIVRVPGSQGRVTDEHVFRWPENNITTPRCIPYASQGLDEKLDQCRSDQCVALLSPRNDTRGRDREAEPGTR